MTYVVDPNARWNWWILNHGILIASALITLAAVTFGLRFVPDRRVASPTTSITPIVPAPTVGPSSSSSSSTSAAPSTTAAPPTTIPTEVLSTEVVLVDSSESSTPSSSTTVVATTVAATTSTVAATTTASPTTVAATTSAVPASTTTAAEPARIAAIQLPHLQLGKVPVTWVQVSRRITSRASSVPTEAAMSFRWVGPQAESSVTLQIASGTSLAPSNRKTTVRGHDAVLASVAGNLSVQWMESPGIVAAITVQGFSEAEAVTFANDLTNVSDPEWERLIQRAKLVAAPAWDRVLLEDW